MDENRLIIDEVSALRAIFSAGARPPDPMQDGALLRMYPPGSDPRVGSFRADGLDIDSHWHFHDMHQLVYAFEGAIVVESARGRHLVPPQLAAWIPAGEQHRLSVHQVKSASIFFPVSMVRSPDDRVRTIMVRPLMREMVNEAMRWRLRDAPSKLGERFYDAMAGLCEEWILEEADLMLPVVNSARLQSALDYTAGQIDAQLSDVCAHAGLSPRTLRRHLRQETGLSWDMFRQRCRLLRAIALLAEGKEPIGQIAAECGYESPSAFAKSFRQALGVTPREYQRRMLSV
jgi:AraC-like DNA-binding protein